MPNTENDSVIIKLFKADSDKKYTASGYIIVRGLKFRINVYKSESGIRVLWPSIKIGEEWREVAGPVDLESRKNWAILIRDELKKLDAKEEIREEVPQKYPTDSLDNWM